MGPRLRRPRAGRPRRDDTVSDLRVCGLLVGNWRAGAPALWVVGFVSEDAGACFLSNLRSKISGTV